MASTTVATRAQLDIGKSVPVAVLILLPFASFGGLLPFIQRPAAAFLLAAIATLCLIPLLGRIVSRGFDLFEPLTVANVVFLVLFVGRPIADLLSGRELHVGPGADYDITGYFDSALVLCLVGVAAFQIGYLVLPTMLRLRAPAPPTGELAPGRLIKSALVLGVVGLALFALYVRVTNLGFDYLLIGRDLRQQAVARESTGYLYNAALLCGPACLLLVSVAMTTARRWWLLLVGALLLAVPLLIDIGEGNRWGLLLLLGPSGIYWYMRRGRRPGVPMVLLIGYLSLSIGVGFLGPTRNVGTAANSDRMGVLASSLSNPAADVDKLFSSGDTEMFDSLTNELAVVPTQLPFRPGATVLDVAVRAVPRPLWPDKPLEANDAVVQTLWPAWFAVSRGAPYFSLIGPLYADSGYFAVVVGMMIAGLVFELVWFQYTTWKSQSPAVLLIASSAIPFVPILLRATVTETVANALFVVAPTVLACHYARMRTAQQSSG